MKLECQNSTCGHVCEEDEAGTYREHTRSEFWGTVAVTTEEFSCCPHCGSDVEEIPNPVMCIECGARPPVSGDDLCQPCIALEDDKAADLILEDEPFDYEKIKREAKERARNEFTQMLIETATSPWRRVS